MNNARLSKILEEELIKKTICKKKSKITLSILTIMTELYDILEDLA